MAGRDRGNDESDQLDLYSITTGSRGTGGAVDLVLVPRGSPLGPGFEMARRLLDRGAHVRLVGEGVTVRTVWPEWVAGQDRLVLTELGAYVTVESVERAAEATDDLKEWADRVFSGVVPGQRGSDIFYGAAAMRIFWHRLMAYPALVGVVASHRAGRYHCSDPRWPGIGLLSWLCREAGGELLPVERPRRRGRIASFLAVSVAALALTVLHQVVLYLRSGRSRRKLRDIRKRSISDSKRIWLVLSPLWARSNRHVLSTVLEPLVRDGVWPGVIAYGDIRPGRKDEQRLNRFISKEIWPGLEMSDEDLVKCSFEQVGNPESIGQLAACVWQGTVRSLKVILRFVNDGLAAGRGPLKVDLSDRVPTVARLATVDVFRAVASERATARAIGRHDFGDSLVIFTASGTWPEMTVPDLLLQRAGATTVDFWHGVTGAWYYFYPLVSSLRSYQIECDARAALCDRWPFVVSEVTDRLLPDRDRPGRKTTNILIVSAYAHRDTLNDGTLPGLPFQSELLGVVDQIRSVFGDRFRFRWRPHPADLDEPVREAHGGLRDVELSRGAPLEEDARWADVIVTCFSTVAFEALSLRVPIFLHTIPGLRDFPSVLGFHRSRKFFYASEIVRPFTECIRALDEGDPTVLEPEREAGETLFARTGELDELVARYKYDPAGAQGAVGSSSEALWGGLPIAKPIGTRRSEARP